jgi:hypothetical protein
VQTRPAVTARLGLGGPLRIVASAGSRGAKWSRGRTRSRTPIFSAAEMRHNFAIWALERDAALGRRLHVYYCVRCRWAFSVDDRSGSVNPVGVDGNPIKGPAAATRLATFAQGPCPAFSVLDGSSRLTQKITSVSTSPRWLAVVIRKVGRVWESLIHRRMGESCSPGNRQEGKGR